jgi:hypothetical protein
MEVQFKYRSIVFYEESRVLGHSQTLDGFNIYIGQPAPWPGNPLLDI